MTINEVLQAMIEAAKAKNWVELAFLTLKLAVLAWGLFREDGPQPVGLVEMDDETMRLANELNVELSGQYEAFAGPISGLILAMLIRKAIALILEHLSETGLPQELLDIIESMLAALLAKM
jgi:hypothetical protein